MASAPSAKKAKQSRQRPQATTQLANAVSEQVDRSGEILCSFSPDASHFAILFSVLNKDRLCVYEALTGKVVADYTPDSGNVTTLSWGELLIGTDDGAGGRQSNTKKRKKRSEQEDSQSTSPAVTQGSHVVLIGMSNGTSELFSPTHGRVVRTLSHATVNSAVKSIQFVPHTQGDQRVSLVCVAVSDGDIYIWNATHNSYVGKLTHETPNIFDVIQFRTQSSYLAGGKGISLFRTENQELHSGKAVRSKRIKQYSGHSTSVKALSWEACKEPRRFISIGENDRFLNVWEASDIENRVSDDLLASVAFSDHIRSISMDKYSERDEQLFFGLTTSGVGSIYQMPMSKLQTKSTLLPRTTIKILSTSSSRVELISAAFVPQKKGILRLAILTAGIKVAIEDVVYREEGGVFLEDLVINKKLPISGENDQESESAGRLSRYNERPGVSVGSGSLIESASQANEQSNLINEGSLDVDIAELSLGQRLAAGQTDLSGSQPERTTSNTEISVNSLARTLTQALHSSDSGLLEQCLSHSDPATIQSTVERLAAQFALPLLGACVERLGRGHRGTSLKGGGGGASSQRGTTLIAWVRSVLIVHSSHLMAIPDLASRLSDLHALLTSRLAMHDRLLGLSGRLDLVLTQMEMRSSNQPAPVVPIRERPRATKPRVTAYYREGESSDDADVQDLHAETEEEGSVEDIDLTMEDDLSDEEVESDDSAYADEGASPLKAGRANGFVDGEAEEWSGSEESADGDD